MVKEIRQKESCVLLKFREYILSSVKASVYVQYVYLGTHSI